MRRKKIKFFLLTVTFLLFLTCLSSIYASSDVNDTVEGEATNEIYKSVEDNNKIYANKKTDLNITVNKVNSNNYLSSTKVTGKITTEDKKLPDDKYIHLYVNNKKQSKTNFTLMKNGTFKYTTKQKIGDHTFKIHINDPKYKTKTTTTNFTVTDKIFPELNKSRPIYFAMDHTNRKDRQICNNIVQKLKQEGFKVVRYKIGPNAMYQNMVHLYRNNIHNAIMFHLFNGVDPSNIREVAEYGPDNRGRIVRQRGNDAVLAWFYDASDPIHVGGNCYYSVRGSETGSRLYNPKEYMDKNNIYSICTSSDRYKHMSTADYNGDKTTLEFMKLFTNDKNLKYKTTTKADVTLTDDYLITIKGTVTYPTSTVHGYAKITDNNGKTIIDNVLVQNNHFTTKFISKNIGKQDYTIRYKGSPLYMPSYKIVTATITLKNITIDARQEDKYIENNSVHITLRETNTRELLADQLVKIIADGKTYTYYTDNNGSILANINTKRNQTIRIHAYHDNKLLNSTKLKIKVYKENVNVYLESIKGIVGDKIELKAHVTDSNGNPVNGGKIYFKLNGNVLRKDNSICSNKTILKLKVVNGTVTYNLTGDYYFNAKKITAAYEATARYKNKTSNAVKAVITKRHAKMNVSVTRNNSLISFVADIRDTKNSNELLFKNAYVYFKVNDEILKYPNGKEVKKKLDNNGTAVYTCRLSSIENILAENGSVVTCEYVNSNYYSVSCNRKFIV